MTVQVRDTGIGIKAQDLPKLFSAFERIEEKRNRTIEGTGLGMNITQQLLGMMGSRLKVTSVYGQGSTFSFTVIQDVIDWQPLGEIQTSLRQIRSQMAVQAGSSGSFTAPTARVLIVDDTEMNLKVMQSLLKRTLIRVDTAISGPACLQMVKKVHYDMIFLDHRMPGMDGIETLQRLNVIEHQSKAAPVVALTANAVSGAREQYLAAGFNEYLTKPVDAEKLEKLLLEYLPTEKVTHIKADAGRVHAEAVAAKRPDWLGNSPELNWEVGQHNCGSQEAYLDALQLFYDSLPETLSVIRGFYETGDWKNYTIKVHALKSSARIIGARLLSKLAERLEAAGDAGRLEEIHRDTKALLDRGTALARLLTPLSAQKPVTDEQAETMTADELAEAYEALREFATAFDYDDAMFVLESLDGKQPPTAEREHWEAVVRAARKPDWDKLQELLSGMRI